MNLRCNNVTMVVSKPTEGNFVTFPLSRNKFDIIFSINNLSNSENIKTILLCHQNMVDKEYEGIIDISLGSDIMIPLYIIMYTELFIGVEYDSKDNIPESIEMVYTAGLLQNRYRNDRTIDFPIKIDYD